MDATPRIELPPSAASAPPPSFEPRLSTRTTLSFVLGGVGLSVSGVALAGQVLQYYFNQVLGIAPLVVGTGIMISMIFDAVFDPVVGWWSDNVRSPLGRRHPFMYVMAILAPISFYFVWNAPHALKGAALVVLMMTVLTLSRVSGGLFSLTFGSLAPELAPGYNQRTRLLSYLTLASLVGSVAMSLLLGFVFLRHDARHPLGLLNRAGYEALGVTGALVMLVAMLVSSLGTQGYVRHLHAPAPRKITPAAAIREIVVILSHPSLMMLLVATILGGVGTGIAGGLNYYIMTHFWLLEPQQLTILGLAGLGASLLGAAGAPFLASRFGKKPAMLATLAVACFTGFIPITLKLVGLMPPSSSPWVMIILVGDTMVASCLGAMGGVIIASMLSDLVEDSAVKTGVRSEGLMFAAMGLTPKITVGIGAFLAGVALTMVNFPVHAPMGTVPFALMRHLVLLYLPANAILTGLSVAVLAFYRIDKATHEQNLARLRERGMTLAP